MVGISLPHSYAEFIVDKSNLLLKQRMAAVLWSLWKHRNLKFWQNEQELCVHVFDPGSTLNGRMAVSATSVSAFIYAEQVRTCQRHLSAAPTITVSACASTVSKSFSVAETTTR